MSPKGHAVISAGLGGFLGAWLNSWEAGLACFLSGIFIDLDHHLDYFLANKKIPLTYKELYDFGCFTTTAPLCLFLHGYEWLIILWVLVYYGLLGSLGLGVALGTTAHLLCDQFTNPIRPLGYFLLYRIKHQFKRKDILRDEYFQKILQLAQNKH